MTDFDRLEAKTRIIVYLEIQNLLQQKINDLELELKETKK